MGILSSENRAALLRYKYKGSDASPVYNYVLSPFAQRCVDLVPTWVAPNLITLTGFLIALSAVVLSLTLNPSLDRTAPQWVSGYSALALFVYQTMDNMDGKQVRTDNLSFAVR
jgi:ethanolaminephosphotransferase